MLEIETKYAIELFFSKSAFEQVYFEAVANALDAEANEVTIHISTDGKINPQYLEITISDNGKGFTDERFERFRRLKKPSDPYHKGLGRLVYLNYFKSIDVVSIFGRKKRTFNFSSTSSVDSQVTDALKSEQQGTKLRFGGFLGTRLRSYDDLKPSILKAKLLEHFLPVFHERKKTKQDFKISIHLFSEISMYYVLREGLGETSLLTAACIDGRTIPMNLLNLSAIPLNHSAIFLFESKLFIGKSDSSRQRLVLPEDVSEDTFHHVLRRKISAVLNDKLPEIAEKNTKTKQQFEERYPHLIGLFDEDTVGLINKEEAIEIAQRRFLKKQMEVLEKDSLDDATFKKSLEVSSRTLTEYILYRELIINRLREMDAQNREADIHNLIVPRYQQFHEVDLINGIYSNNAWLLDDKFMSFRTILSEAKMQEVIEAITLSEDIVVNEGEGRPDISMIFSADPAKIEKVDVVVIEIKRKTVDDKENTYATTQLLKRARKLVDYCPSIQRVWYFAIIEIDEALSQLLEDSKWTPLFSKGQVFYQDFSVKRGDGTPVLTPVCLLSYDAVIEDAATRNHTFLEILKNGFKKAKSSH
jgi:hypothetical protein